MKKMIVAVSIASALAITAPAQAEVKITGSMGFKAVVPDNDEDLDLKSSKSRINFKGVKPIREGLTLIGEIEVDFDDAANNGSGVGDVDVRLSRMYLLGKFGAFVMAGRSTSGQQADLVGPVDRFQHGGAAFFDQAGSVSNAIAYATPTFGGGAQFIISSVVVAEDNDVVIDAAGNTVNVTGEDIDVMAYRLKYTHEKFTAAVGLVDYDIAAGSSRVGLGVSTDIGKVNLGLAYESATDRAQNQEVFGVAATFPMSESMSLSAGYNTILASDDAASEDAAAYQLLIEKTYADGISAWAELDGFNDESGMDGAFAFGMNMSF